MAIRLLDDRPEVLADTKYPNPFKKESIDSVGRGFSHLSGGRFVVAGHGRSYDAKDNSDRRFHFALYESSGSLVAHDMTNGKCYQIIGKDTGFVYPAYIFVCLTINCLMVRHTNIYAG